MYKIKWFPILRAEKQRSVRSKLVHVMPDGRSVVDANELFKDDQVKLLVEKLTELERAKHGKK